MLLNVAHSMLHHVVVKVRRARPRRAVHRMIARTRPGAGQLDDKSMALAQQIERDGFVHLGRPFSEEKLRKLRTAIEVCPCFDQWRPEYGRFKLEDTPGHVNTGRVIGVENIPEAMEIANDPAMTAIAAAYLGCKPHIDAPLAWWSFPRKEAYQEQFYHRDNPSSRWVKLFVYLSDVGDQDGPHIFVESSQRTDELLAPGKRFTDDEVSSICGPDRIMRMTGPFGTAFLEDTWGLHKGELPTSGVRLVLEVTYTAYPVPKPVFSGRAAGAAPEESA